MEICIYCREPRLYKIGCCKENHWDEVTEDEYELEIENETQADSLQNTGIYTSKPC